MLASREGWLVVTKRGGAGLVTRQRAGTAGGLPASKSYVTEEQKDRVQGIRAVAESTYLGSGVDRFP